MRTAVGVIALITVALVAVLSSPAFATPEYTVSGAVSAQGGSVFGITGTEVVVRPAGSGEVVASTTTDPEGSYSVSVPEGAYDITFTPPLGSGYSSFTNHGEPLASNRTLNVTLVPSGTVTFSGVLRDEDGVPVPWHEVALRSGAGTIAMNTGDEGTFSFTVAPGPYVLAVYGSRPPGLPAEALPEDSEFDGEVDLVESEQQDLTLPLHVLTVRTVGPSGEPIAGVSFDARFGRSAPAVDGSLAPGIAVTYVYVQEEAISDEHGAMVLSVPDYTENGDSGLLIPPPGSDLSATSLDIDHITSDTTETVQLSSGVTLSGSLQGDGGVALSGYEVALRSGASSVSAKTESDGSFSLTVTPGPYTLVISGRRPSGVSPAVAPAYSYLQASVSLGESEQQNLTLPVHALTVSTLDSSSEPVPGVSFDADFSSSAVDGLLAPGILVNDAYVEEEATSDETGQMVLSLPDYTQAGEAGLLNPPAASRLAATPLDIANIAEDQSENIYLSEGVRFSGLLRNGDGVALPGYTVKLSPKGEQGSISTVTDSDGSFSFAVEPGAYIAEEEGLRPAGITSSIAPSFVRFAEEITLDESEHQDLALPMHTLTVKAVGPSGDPVSGVAFDGNFSSDDVGGSLAPGTTLIYGYVQEHETSNENGIMELTVPDFTGNDDSGLLEPPLDTQLGATPLSIDGVAEDETRIIDFQPSAMDMAPPVVSCEEPDSSWHAANVSIACTASDSGTGLANPEDASFTLSTNVTEDEETASAATDSRRVCDLADNCATAGPVTGIKVDRKAPSISIVSPGEGSTVQQGSSLIADYSCSDGGSGVAACNGSTGNGQSLDTSTLGPHTLTVTSVDQTGNTSTATVTYTVLASGSITLSSSEDPSPYGARVSFTAKITPASEGGPTPTGRVSFYDGSTVLGSASLVRGSATYSTSVLGVGSHTITAAYSGDSRNPASESPGVVQVISRASTELTLTSSANPTVFGSSATLRAVLKAIAPGHGTPTGTVTFSEGETTLATVSMSAGSATYRLSGLGVGKHTIVATYNGDGDFSSAEPQEVSEAIENASTQVNLTNNADPSTYGQAVTLKAAVEPLSPAGGTPTGAVTFSEGTTTLATITLVNGSASYHMPNRDVGEYPITATYSGDPNYWTSGSGVVLIVQSASTQLTLTSSANPTAFGSTGTLKAAVGTVAPGHGIATGTVVFSEGMTTLATIPLNNGSADYQLSNLGAGTHTITVTYSPSGPDFAATEAKSLTEQIESSQTKLTLTRSANPAKVGSEAYVKATVKAAAPGGGTPVGTVTFKQGSETLAVLTLEEGAARLPVGGLSVGEHTITAVYNETTNYLASEPVVIIQTINK